MDVLGKDIKRIVIYLQIIYRNMSIPGFVKELGKSKDLSPSRIFTVGKMAGAANKNNKFFCPRDEDVGSLLVRQKSEHGIRAQILFSNL
jgi:hypothetical protein